MREPVRMKSRFRTDTAKYANEPLSHRLEVARFLICENVYAHSLVAVGPVCLCKIHQEIGDCGSDRIEMSHALLACCTRRIP